MPDTDMFMWVVYDSPADFPGRFVVRKWVIRKSGEQPTTEVYHAKTLEGVRAMVSHGLVCIPRDENDNPNIVETWL